MLCVCKFAGGGKGQASKSSSAPATRGGSSAPVVKATALKPQDYLAALDEDSEGTSVCQHDSHPECRPRILPDPLTDLMDVYRMRILGWMAFQELYIDRCSTERCGEELDR